MLLCNYKGPHYDHRKCYSLKNKPLSCPHFVKTTSILSKILCPHVIFSKNFMINIPLSCPCLVKKRQFCQNYTILWAPKVNRMPFFRFISNKITTLMPLFRQKNVHSLKITMLSCPYFVIKTSIL